MPSWSTLTNTFPVIFNHVNNSKWSNGPWDHEPDYARWIDFNTGLLCQIIRHEHFGCLNGYVELPASLNALDIDSLDVHGSITYSQAMTLPHQSENCYQVSDDTVWVGFDCAHAWDVVPLWQNFGPNTAYRTWDYVYDEVCNLATQVWRYNEHFP